MPKQHDNVYALREYQRWRRGAEIEMMQPAKIGELLDWAIRVCEAADRTIAENGHLADGESCTLRELRDAVHGNRGGS